MSRKLSQLFSAIIPTQIERKFRVFKDKTLKRYSYTPLPEEIFQQDKFNSIAFCITCMNRLYQLKETIERNIKDNQSYPNVSFVLIDYNSQDGLEDYVKKNLTYYIDSGVLKYYKTFEPKKFHASKAKNLAHLLAEADIVCNLDGDNFTGKDFAYYLNYLFNKYGDNYIFQFHKPPNWGTIGRLALTKTNFRKLGGYDENLLSIGHEDLDFLERAKSSGISYRREEIENFQKYIGNSIVEKAVNCSDNNESYTSLESENIKISKQNIATGLLVANAHGFENYTIFKNLKPEPLDSGEVIKSLAKS